MILLSLIKSCFVGTDMSSTAFIEPLPVIDFVTQLLNRDVSARPLSDADRVKVGFPFLIYSSLLFCYLCSTIPVLLSCICFRN